MCFVRGWFVEWRIGLEDFSRSPARCTDRPWFDCREGLVVWVFTEAKGEGERYALSCAFVKLDSGFSTSYAPEDLLPSPA